MIFCLPRKCGSGLASALLALSHAPGGDKESDSAIEHKVIYHESGRFGGWPANHGIWIWGDEILVGFSAAYYKDYQGTTHAVDRRKPEHHLLARSLDGGETWAITDPAEQGVMIPQGKMLMGSELPNVEIPPLKKLEKPIDFTHPDLALTFRMDDYGSNGQSRFYYSYDRGKNWNGPFELPKFGTTGISARTDYIINSSSDLLVFLSGDKSNGKQGRPLCAQTKDGGLSWELVAWIGEEPEDNDYTLMPSSVRLNEKELLTMTRVRGKPLAAYHSGDNGKTWTLRNDHVALTGKMNSRTNPPSLLNLRDGRLVVIYGFRAEPFGIRARFSSDEGRTWGDEVVLRDDGVSWDIGYPRSAQRPDGKVVTVYYFHDEKHGPEPHIAGTIWDTERF